jgi:hypothetical protein
VTRSALAVEREVIPARFVALLGRYGVPARAERDEPHLLVVGEHAARVEQHGGLPDRAARGRRVDVDEQVGAQPAGEVLEPPLHVGPAGKIEADTALAPHDQVGAAGRQPPACGDLAGEPLLRTVHDTQCSGLATSLTVPSPPTVAGAAR